MNKNLITVTVVAVLVLSVGLAVAILSQGNNSEDKNSDGAQITSPTDPDGNQNIVDYALDLDNYSITPNLIAAVPGETLKIKLINKNGIHNFVIDELNVKSKTLNDFGEEVIIEVTVPEDAKAGKYEFYCGIAGHRELGMVGIFEIVSEQ